MADRSSLELVRDWQAERDTIDDELVVVNAQATTILQKQKQLERRRSRLRCTIEYWNTTRPFKHFLRLPVEIREMIYNRYIERIHSHGKYISVDRNVFFPDEYAKSIALVSKQVREEYLNWLGLNRPLDLMMLLRVILRRQFTRSKRAAWDRLPAQILIELQVARAELTMLEDHRRPVDPRRPRKIDPSDVHWGRVRLVAEIIIGEGGKLKKKHLELLIDALKDNDDIIDSQAWLNQALERGEAAKKLRTGKGRKKLPDSFPGSDAWWLEKWGR